MKVGDEIIQKVTKERFVITHIRESRKMFSDKRDTLYTCISSNGTAFETEWIDHFEATGKHFSQVEELLANMQKSGRIPNELERD